MVPKYSKCPSVKFCPTLPFETDSRTWPICTKSIAFINSGYYWCLYVGISGGSRISRRGGVDLVGGGVDSRGGYVLKILYVKTKELGPLGGARAGRAPLDPPMGMKGIAKSTNNGLDLNASFSFETAYLTEHTVKIL